MASSGRADEFNEPRNVADFRPGAVELLFGSSAFIRTDPPNNLHVSQSRV
jgi:hypothetical protein